MSSSQDQHAPSRPAELGVAAGNAVTASAGDYLKAIYELAKGAEWVSPSSLARHLGVSAPSVTARTQKLADEGYATYVPYRGVALTDKGRRVALELLRHHRLLELYLEKALGYTWDRVHDEAEKLEHTISEEFEDRIDAVLGFPTEDPHGDPIPPKRGEYREEPMDTLWAAVAPLLTVRRVSDRDPDVLRYLAGVGIRPGVTVEVLARAPFDGPVTVRVQGAERILGERLASQIFVTTASGAERERSASRPERTRP